MGKTKRIRQKFHAPAKIKDGGDKEMASSSNMDFAVPAPSNNIPISRDLFSGLSIPVGQGLETRSLMNVDETLSVASLRSTKSSFRDGSKKDRRKERREHLLNALYSVEAAKKALAAKRKREKTAVVGDMRPLVDSLPTVEEMLQAAKEDKDKQQSQVNSKKLKHLEKKMNEDMSTFLAIAECKEYQDDMFNLVGVSIEERLKRYKEGKE